MKIGNRSALSRSGPDYYFLRPIRGASLSIARKRLKRKRRTGK